MTQKITPFLWYDKEAGEAARFYSSVFGGKIKSKQVMTDTPSGTVEVYGIEIVDYDFTLMSAGPTFKINPSISFHIKCKTVEGVNNLWRKLSPGGKVLMEIGKYPFSERFGWIQDKYGVSWQIIHAGDRDMKQRVTPALLFVNKALGKAEDAINFYTSVFPNSKIGNMQYYGKGEKPDKEGTLKYGSFTLEGLEFGAMDSAHKHQFNFNEAISFVIDCKDQEEVDYYWKKLTSGGGQESVCGWLKDKYGVSWQVTPRALMELTKKDKSGQVTQAMLKMKKINVKKLEEVYKKNN